MTKQDFLKALKEIVVTCEHRDDWRDAFPKIFSDMKELTGKYDAELLEKVRCKYYDDEQAAALIRSQKTFFDMHFVMYYVDHFTGIYEYAPYKHNGEPFIDLYDVGPYDVYDYILELLGEKPREKDDEYDDDDEENEEDKE